MDNISLRFKGSRSLGTRIDEYKRRIFSHIVNRCLGAKLTGSNGVTHSGQQEGERISPPANLKRVIAEAVNRLDDSSQEFKIVNLFDAFVSVHGARPRDLRFLDLTL